jgi:hypothetical protein
MELTLLTVSACPNAAAFEERLAAALAGRPGAVVHRREVADERGRRRPGCTGRRRCRSTAWTRSPGRTRAPACRAGCTGTRRGALEGRRRWKRSGRLAEAGHD